MEETFKLPKEIKDRTKINATENCRLQLGALKFQTGPDGNGVSATSHSLSLSKPGSLTLQTQQRPASPSLARPHPPSMLNTPRRLASKSELDRKYENILKQTGFITLNGKKYECRVDDLESLGELGRGTCGQVMKMRHRPTGHVIAVKQMRRSGNAEENKRILTDLETVLKAHDCVYIVQCLGSLITDSDVWICMELMSSCLDKVLRELREPLPEPVLGKIAGAAVKALHYLKDKHNIIHRDVKPSNILIDTSGNIKLCDFSISGQLIDSQAQTRNAGCAAYMAPERIEPPDPSNMRYDIRADVWSLGITMVELATGCFPYKACSSPFEVMARVVQDPPPRLEPTRGYSRELCDFVNQCLEFDVKKRPKYRTLLESAFLRRYERESVDVGGWYRVILERLQQKHQPLSPASLGSEGAAEATPLSSDADMP